MRLILDIRRLPLSSTPINMIRNIQDILLQGCSSLKVINRSGNPSTTPSSQISDLETRLLRVWHYLYLPPSCQLLSSTYLTPSWILPWVQGPLLRWGRKLWSVCQGWSRKMLISSISRRCLDLLEKSLKEDTQEHSACWVEEPHSCWPSWTKSTLTNWFKFSQRLLDCCIA